MDRGKLTMAWYAVMTAFFYMYFAAFIALAYGNGQRPDRHRADRHLLRADQQP
jgi:cbb3-type cytochrome oxidase subunit 3